MRLKAHPLLLGYKLVCHNCGSKKLREYDPFRNGATDPEQWVPDRLVLECKDCDIMIFPENDLEREKNES